MDAESVGEHVRVRASSPGEHPILIVELANGSLVAAYHETGYDLGRTKPVEEEWMRDNAVGRHSFVEINPPVEVAASELGDYARREVIGGT